MSDNRYTEEELRAKEEAYREYLRLRQEAPKVSITDTPYGASQLRKKQSEEEAKEAYRRAREEGRKGVKPRKRAERTQTVKPERANSKTRAENRRTDVREQGRPERRKTERRNSERRTAGPEREKKRSADRRPQKRNVRNGRNPNSSVKTHPMAENSTIASTVVKKKKRFGGKGSGKKGGLMKYRGVRRITLILAAILLGIILLVAGTFIVAANTLGSVGSLDMEKNNLAISNQAKDTLKDYKNIAILGVDTRDVEDDTESRSDAMIVMSINKKTNEVRMFSVFRDTMLDLGGDHGLDKLTHAYSYGGAELTVAALNRNLDLNIRKAVVINWKTVAEVIDSLGGITIDVKESEIDELNKYIKGTSKVTDSERVEIEEPGKQTLNGAQAVTYARIRQDDPRGDYRRNERMKIVMATTFKKAKKADIFTLKRICDNALPDAKTNLTTTEMMGMALKFKKYDMTSSTTGWPYDVEGWIGEAGGGAAWYGPPVTLESNVKKLYKKFFGISGYEPTEEVRSISNNISELTGLY